MNYENKGKCLICEKDFKDGWNDFFCCQDHALRYRYQAEAKDLDKDK